MKTLEDRAKVFSALLARLRESGNSAVEFMGGLDRERFLADKLRQSAVAQALGVFGETVSRLMELFPEVAEKNPDIEWRKIKGLRNRIVHD
jgi:uncharacterized protein with HEPN domain